MTTPLVDAGAHGAVTALVRALDLRSPAAARRAALRAAIVHACLEDLDVSADASAVCLATTLLAEVSELFSNDDPIEGAADVAVLLVDCPGLEDAAVAVFHEFEWVDGTGQPYGLVGDDIPAASRLHAVADSLAGSVDAADGVIGWDDAIEHMKELAGTRLDLRLSDVCFQATRPAHVRAAIDGIDVKAALALLPSPVGSLRPPERSASLLSRARAFIRSVPRPVEVIRLLCEDALVSLPAMGVGVGALQPDNEQLELVASSGELPASLRTLPVHPMLMSADTSTSTTTVQVDAAGFGTVLAATVPGTAGPWGVVWAVSGADASFDDAASRELVTLAHGIADAMAQGASIGQLVNAASLDALTLVYNRRSLDQRLERLFSQADDERADSALIMCDVDDLKVVNDTDGHEAGDAVLIAAAGALQRVAAQHDRSAVFRIGGDEFCILVPAGGLLKGEDIAHAADAAVREATAGRVSASCGVGYGIHALTPADLLRRADEAQYVVKRGRSTRARSIDGDPGRGRRILRDA